MRKAKRLELYSKLNARFCSFQHIAILFRTKTVPARVSRAAPTWNTKPPRDPQDNAVIRPRLRSGTLISTCAWEVMTNSIILIPRMLKPLRLARVHGYLVERVA